MESCIRELGEEVQLNPTAGAEGTGGPGPGPAPPGTVCDPETKYPAEDCPDRSP